MENGLSSVIVSSTVLQEVDQAEQYSHVLPPWLGPFAWGVYALLQISWLAWAWQMVISGTGDFDFSTYYSAARALRLDQHANIYSATVLTASGIAGHVFLLPPLPFTHPPLAAILLEPITILSFSQATHVWVALNLIVWLVCTFVLAGEAYFILKPGLAARTHAAGGPSSQRMPGWISDPVVPIALALTALVCLSERPGAQTITLGQINFLVALPLTLVPRLLRSEHDRWAGAAIAFAAMLKLTPILLLGYLLLRRRQRAWISLLITLILLSLFCLLIVGPTNLLAVIPQALHVGSTDASLPQNEALLAVPLRVIHMTISISAATANDLSYVLLLLIAVAIGIAIKQKSYGDTKVHDTAADTLTYGLALCGMLLIAPTVWMHHYIWLLPALVIALACSLRSVLQTDVPTMQRRSAIIQLGLCIISWMIIAYTLPFDLDFQPFLHATMVFGLSLTDWSHWLRPIATLILAGVLTSCIWQRRSVRPSVISASASPQESKE